MYEDRFGIFCHEERGIMQAAQRRYEYEKDHDLRIYGNAAMRYIVRYVSVNKSPASSSSAEQTDAESKFNL